MNLSVQTWSFDSNPVLKTDGSYTQQHSSFARLKKDYQFPPVKIQGQDEADLLVEFAGESYRIEPSTEHKLVTSTQSVVKEGTDEEITVTPKINIHHYGWNDVYGKLNTITLPKKASRYRIKQIRNQLIQEANSRAGCSMEETKSFYIFDTC